MALLTLFAGSMLGLVLADNLIVLYGFWELTTITSFLLIGNNHTDGRARAAALQALLVTSAGALAMLAGFVILGQAAGTYRISELVDDPPSGTAVEVALALVLVGAFTKSAQYPFHGWLPAAMVAPTPVSAYLHSATMVKAGVYLIARLSPAFADVALWRPVVVFVGLYTMVAGRAAGDAPDRSQAAAGDGHGEPTRLHDRRVRARHRPNHRCAGCVVLLAHALYKAAAFMVVGILDHQHGTRDTRLIPRPIAGLAADGAGHGGRRRRRWPVCRWCSDSSPRKRCSRRSSTSSGIGPHARLAAAALIGSIAHRRLQPPLRAWAALGCLSGRGSALAADVLARAAAAVVRGAGVVLSAVARWSPAWCRVCSTTSSAALRPILDDEVVDVHLAVWHGFNQPLVLSVVALAAGAALFAARAAGRPRAACLQPSPVSSSARLPGDAARAQRARQPGDRRRAVGLAADLPRRHPADRSRRARRAAGRRATWWPGLPDLVDTPLQVPIAAVILGAAVAAAAVRRRFTAALFLGVVGYSMAGLFVIQGAPDLALTQVAIESLTTVLFVLVLRRLPDRFESRRCRCGGGRSGSGSPVSSASPCSRSRCLPARSIRRPRLRRDDRAIRYPKAAAATSST